MRSLVGSVLAVMILGCASATLAQEPEDKYPRLVKPKGDREDIAQLGGEPSLTEAETEQGPAAKVEEQEDDCDLDCLEAQLAEEEEREKQK